MELISQSLAGLPSFLLYFALGIAVFAAFCVVYAAVTPYDELALIREGNVAAAISLGGAVLGFVLPLASAIAHSVGPVDMVVWGLDRPGGSGRRVFPRGATRSPFRRGDTRGPRRRRDAACRAGRRDRHPQCGMHDVLNGC